MEVACEAKGRTHTKPQGPKRPWVGRGVNLHVFIQSWWSWPYCVFHSPGHHWASLVAQMVKNLTAMQETWVRSLGWENPLEEGMQPTPIFLPGESHGQRSLVGYSPWGYEESDTTEHTQTYTHTRAYMFVFNIAEIILAMSFLHSFFTWQYIISSYSLAVIIVNIPFYPFII